MIQCKNCGKMVKEGPPYCSGCGYRLPGSPEPSRQGSPMNGAPTASSLNADGSAAQTSRQGLPMNRTATITSLNAGEDAQIPGQGSPMNGMAAALSLSAEGNACAKRGDYAEALVFYDQALAMEPGNHKTWHNKGIVLKRLGDISGAQECLERARVLKETPAMTGPAPLPAMNGTCAGTTPCVRCGKPLPEASLFCPSCGAPREEGSPGKNPRYAAVFSLLIPGLGQVYNGDTVRAILVLLGTIAGSFLLFIPGIAVWMYGVVNAYRSAKRINAGQVGIRARSDLFMILYVVVAVILVTAVFIVISSVIAAFTLGVAAPAAGSG